MREIPAVADGATFEVTATGGETSATIAIGWARMERAVMEAVFRPVAAMPPGMGDDLRRVLRDEREWTPAGGHPFGTYREEFEGGAVEVRLVTAP